MLRVRRMTLETRCPECDVLVKVENRSVILTLITDDRGEYRFRCPLCEQDVTKLADAEVLARLRQAGIRAVNEVPPQRGGPPLDEDDLIEFGRSLEGGDPWAELDGRSSLPG